jgi:hypothetical protein
MLWTIEKIQTQQHLAVMAGKGIMFMNASAVFL